MKHTCHHPRCDVAVPEAMFACKPHWFSLPKKIRDRIWEEYVPGQETRKDPTDAYLMVAVDAINFWEGR